MVSIVPVDSAKALGADIVIAVDLQINKNKNTSPSGIKDANRSLWSLIEQGYNSYLNSSAKDSATQAYRQHYAAINEAEIGRADVVIRPDVATISAITTLDREKPLLLALLPPSKTCQPSAQRLLRLTCNIGSIIDTQSLPLNKPKLKNPLSY
nr:hypothetical protein [Psychrobacter sp. PraFG1]UNK05287.1 hypothetical protein MN210_15440 [Psychrobacter sp. PraFG1]